MPGPPHLSPAQQRQIEAEELALAQAAATLEAEQQRLLAAEHYRQEVRAALTPRPVWRRWLWLLPFVAALVGAAALLWFRPAPVADDSWGGIRSSDLMERCRAQVSAQTYGHEPDLRFPSPQEAAGQLSSDADGKRWDGWAARPDGSHLDFSCSYAAGSGDVTVQLIQENP